MNDDQKVFADSESTVLGLKTYYSKLAEEINAAMDKAYAIPPILKTPNERLAAYQQVIKLCGDKLAERFSTSTIEQIVRLK